MSDDALLRRIEALERDNARLRHLLDQGGLTAGRRHQMRNTLAMVRDIVRRTAELAGGVDDYAGALEGRLDTVFRIQNTIANRPLDGIALHMLVHDEMLIHAVGDDARVSVDGPDVLLQPAAAGTVALAIHELAINAIQFGALSAATGRLAVSWTVTEGEDGRPTLVLTWAESGVQTVAPPSRRGFGAEVIESVLAYQLGGKGALDVGPEGLRCMIHLPLTPAVGGLHPARDERARHP